VFPVKYELVFYIPQDDILHSHRRESLKSYKFDKDLYIITEERNDRIEVLSVLAEVK
jgi:hypothetical protein